MCVVCSCAQGYEGAYCQLKSITSSELALLISLSTLLPYAALLVVAVVVIAIYRRLRTTPNLAEAGRPRSNIRAQYDICFCFDNAETSSPKTFIRLNYGLFCRPLRSILLNVGYADSA